MATPTDERRRLAAAVTAAPRDPSLRRSLAVALAKAGEASAALDQYRILLDLAPNDPDAAADAGLMAMRCLREEEVRPIIRAAADAHPGHARLWQVLGLLDRALGELESAAIALDRAAALAPGNALIAHGRARAHLEGGARAVDLFEQTLRLAPEDEAATLGLVSALAAEGRTADAMERLDQVLGRHPEWTDGHATLARLRWMMGERERLTESFDRALESHPTSLPLWRELIATLLHAERFEAAIEAIEHARRGVGPHLILDATEAVSRAEAGQREAADRLFQALRTLDDPSLQVREVRHLLRTGRPREAERLAVRMIATPAADLAWPYLSVTWRLTDDPRWEWLEGDERLVGIYDLSGALPSLDALAERLRALHLALGQPLEQSVRGGTQTDGILFSRTDPEIRDLRRAVVDAVATHVAGLPPADQTHPVLAIRRDAPIRFAGSWSVRLRASGHHANHVHPAGWFSSAFYVVLPVASELGSPPAGWLTLGEPQAELGVDLPPFRTVEPKPGRLVLFPSIMWHGTRPFDAGERMTVAFDVARPF